MKAQITNILVYPVKGWDLILKAMGQHWADSDEVIRTSFDRSFIHLFMKDPQSGNRVPRTVPDPADKGW